MRREDYDILNEILEEFRQEEADLRSRIEENRRLIRESEAHLDVLLAAEPEGFRYFSPRSAENVHREKIKGMRGEISLREKQNETLNARKEVLAFRIQRLAEMVKEQEETPEKQYTEKSESDLLKEIRQPVNPVNGTSQQKEIPPADLPQGDKNTVSTTPRQKEIPPADLPHGDKLALLTSRETQILILIAEGMLNKEIADSLHISERTVKNHISSIFRKIDVWDRTQAAVFAIRNHLVTLD